MDQYKDNLFYGIDDLDQSEKLARLTMNLLDQQKLPANPLNYSIFYLYTTNKNKQLNKDLGDYLNGTKVWTQDVAKSFFTRFVLSHTDFSCEDLREGMLRTVANSLGAAIDAGGQVKLSTNEFKSHIDKLAIASHPNDIFSAISLILNEARTVITKSNALEKDLVNARNDSLVDPLTGLLNRRGFDQVIYEAVSRSRNKNSYFSLLMADLDHFKKINDTYGHLVGDKVLSTFSSMLKSELRKKDFLARYGGEEFAMVLPRIKLDQAIAVAENIRHKLMKLTLKHNANGEMLSGFSVSIGVAEFKAIDTASILIERCDNALYAAKHAGRNCVKSSS